MESIFQITGELSDAAGTLTLKGELTVQHAEEIKKVLMQSVESAAHLVVDMSGVTDVDLACLQLLCTAHRTSAMQKKSFSISHPYREVLENAIQQFGFSRHIGCSFDCNKNCLWATRSGQ